jgi:hypothetical protein
MGEEDWCSMDLWTVSVVIVGWETIFVVVGGIRSLLLLWGLVVKLVRRGCCNFVCNTFLVRRLWVLFELVVFLDSSYLARGSWERRDGRLLLRVWGSWLVVGLGIRR